MNKELKAYKMAEAIVKKSGNRIRFEDAIARTKSYYKKKPFWLTWGTHISDQHAADIIYKSLTR